MKNPRETKPKSCEFPRDFDAKNRRALSSRPNPILFPSPWHAACDRGGRITVAHAGTWLQCRKSTTTTPSCVRSRRRVTTKRRGPDELRDSNHSFRCVGDCRRCCLLAPVALRCGDEGAELDTDVAVSHGRHDLCGSLNRRERP